MSKIQYATIFFLAVLLITCSLEPQPINYGQDPCAFCKMTITDSRYGSELITKKGKIYKFDSIECLVDFVSSMEVPEENIHQLLITDFTASAALIDAKTAQYLISENMPSPMGANLTGFSKREEAEKFSSVHGGEIFSWSELPGELSQNK